MEAENVERRSKSTRSANGTHVYAKDLLFERSQRNHKEAGNTCGFLARTMNVLFPLRRRTTRVVLRRPPSGSASWAINRARSKLSDRLRHTSRARTLAARDVHCSSSSFGANVRRLSVSLNPEEDTRKHPTYFDLWVAVRSRLLTIHRIFPSTIAMVQFLHARNVGMNLA